VYLYNAGKTVQNVKWDVKKRAGLTEFSDNPAREVLVNGLPPLELQLNRSLLPDKLPATRHKTISVSYMFLLMFEQITGKV